MEEENNPSQSVQPQPSTGVTPRRERGGGKKKKIFMTLIILLVVVGLGGGAWFILSSPSESDQPFMPGSGLNEPQENINNSIPSPTPTQPPVEVDKSEIKIELLNGTGIPGEAGLVQKELEELGYTNIEVGNADEQDNKGTVVTFSSNLPESFIREFTNEMENIYVNVETGTSSSIGDFDIRIIAGLRSSYTPAPTKAPVPTSTPVPETTESVTPTPTVSPTPTP